VELFAIAGDSGGSFSCAGPAAVITVGIGYESWWRVVNVLLHEAAEMAAMEMGTRFSMEPDYSGGSDTWRFFMDHNQFSEVIARAANFAAACLPDLARVYNATRRKPKRKAKPCRPKRKK
jgi:hypothetical protein